MTSDEARRRLERMAERRQRNAEIERQRERAYVSGPVELRVFLPEVRRRAEEAEADADALRAALDALGQPKVLAAQHGQRQA